MCVFLCFCVCVFAFIFIISKCFSVGVVVGNHSGDTTEQELCRVFSSYGNVKSTKIIVDRAGVSKGYGFVTFETEQEAQRLQADVCIHCLFCYLLHSSIKSFDITKINLDNWLTIEIYSAFRTHVAVISGRMRSAEGQKIEYCTSD